MKTIIVQAVLLMLDGAGVFGLNCNSCITMAKKVTWPELLKDIQLSNDPKCARMERCNVSHVQGQVPKCVIYTDSATVHYIPLSGDKSKHSMDGELVVRKCETMKTDTPTTCRLYNPQNDHWVDLYNVLKGRTKKLQTKVNFVNMSFTGMRCVGEAYYRPIAPLAKKSRSKSKKKSSSGSLWSCTTASVLALVMTIAVTLI